MHRFSIPADLTSDLRSVASSTRVSLNNLLLAAFGILLRKYSATSEFTIGIPVSGRGNSQSIGYEIDGFPFVFRCDDSVSFCEFAGRVHEDFGAMLRHSNVGVESLQREHGSLFNVMFVSQQPLPAISLGENLRLETEISDLGAAKFDWTLFVRDGLRTRSNVRWSIERTCSTHRPLNVSVGTGNRFFAMSQRRPKRGCRIWIVEAPRIEKAAARLRGDDVSLPMERNCVSEDLEHFASANSDDVGRPS